MNEIVSIEEASLTELTPACEIASCDKCPFGGKRVGGRGNPKAKIVIVGESPGLNELNKGVPFTGMAGTVLWNAIPGGQCDENDHKILILNAMMCHPRDKRDPHRMVEAVNSCNNRLLTQIGQYPRDLIIALGNPAIWSLTGLFNLKITQIRGRPIPSPYARYGIIPAVHPAAILRGTDSFRVFRNDIRYALEIAETGRFKTPIAPEHIILETPEEVARLGERLIYEPEVAADYETSSFNARTGFPLSLGLSYKPQLVYIVPRHLIRYLADYARNKQGKIIWHNGKFDELWGDQDGIQWSVDEDTMLQSYTLDESPRIHDLERVAGDLLGAEDWKYKIKPWVKKKSDSYALIPFPNLATYQSADVSNTLQAFKIQQALIREDVQLNKLYTKTLIPMSKLLAKIQRRGMLVDQDRVRELGDKYVGSFDSFIKTGTMSGGLLPQLESTIQQMAGYPINPNSPQQLAELLFDRFKIKPYDGRSTAKDVLKKLSEYRPPHPIIKPLQEFRKAQKGFATYVVGIYRYSNTIEPDGCIHSVLLLHATRTGRLASREPNVQNIPRDPLLRGMFIPRPGFVFIEIDLNQAELRSLAELSNDGYLVELFNSNTRNLHDEMSEFLFPGWNARKVGTKDQQWEAKEERMRAKAVNFGIPYGREAPSIAEEFNTAASQAQKWIDGWFRRAPGAHTFIKRCRKAAMNGETITTVFGRKKRHWLVTKDNLKDLMNEAANFPHQVIASDVNNHVAMSLTLPEHPLRTERQLDYYDAHIVNLVHDSTLIEAPNDPVAIREITTMACAQAPRIARAWGLKRVPFIADAKVGDRWGYLEDYKIV